jgi:hypothetical protein
MKTRTFLLFSPLGFPRTFFRIPQPWKKSVERGDCGNRGFPSFSAWRGRRRRRHQGAAGTVVAAGDPAAARSQEAQFLQGLVEKNVGVACHGVPLGHHIA